MSIITSIIVGVVGCVLGAVTTIFAIGSHGSKDDEFSCANCKHIENEFDSDEPCCRCRRAYDDEWEVREDG